MSSTDPHLQWVEDWLSPERLHRYREAAGGDTAMGLRLYEWNSQLSAALKHDIDHAEVGLRNAYNRAISSRWSGASHWVHSSTDIFPVLPAQRRRAGRAPQQYDRNDRSRRELDKAVQRAGGRQAPAGKVVAELTLGFWRHLTASERANQMWDGYLTHAFERGTERATVHREVEALTKLRNRVAHAEPLLAIDAAAEHQRICVLTRRFNPELSSYIAATSTTLTVAAQRPPAPAVNPYEQLQHRNRPPGRRTTSSQQPPRRVAPAPDRAAPRRNGPTLGA